MKSPQLLLGAGVVLISSVLALAVGMSAFLWVLIFGSLLAISIGVRYRLYLVNGTLYVRSGKIGVTDFLGRHREMPLETAGALQLCSVVSNAGSQPYLIGLARDGRRTFSIPGADHYTAADIYRVASAAGIDVLGSWGDKVPLSELNRRYPGSLGAVGRLIAGDFNHGEQVLRLVTYVLVIVIVLVVVGVVARSQGLIW